jgi:sulfoxide reductase heme-binding subunit YedZ
VASRVLKPLTFALSLLPVIWCLYQITALQQGQPHALGADPGKAIVDFIGEWTLRFLILTLVVTPVRKVFGILILTRIRRMLGLFTFFYACLHLTAYLVFLLEFRFTDLVTDVVKRPYITIGFCAFLLLVPLAVTSNQWMIRKLKQRWKVLHRLVYLTAILAIVHLVWLTKTDYQEVFIYGLIMAFLLGYRGYQSTWFSRISLIPVRR